MYYHAFKFLSGIRNKMKIPRNKLTLECNNIILFHKHIFNLLCFSKVLFTKNEMLNLFLNILVLKFEISKGI